MKAFDETAKGPLDGVRVLDLTRLIAGNMLTLQLADFGADVVKVEPVIKGDPLRAWTDGGVETFWRVYCRNKKSLAVDLRSEAARGIILSLIDEAQIFIENFRPGRLEAMRLEPEVLLQRNPRLVIVRISGFGQTGPYREKPGFGTLVEAMSGFASRNGFADRDPLLPLLALADMIACLEGAYATMVALREVETKGGPGQVVDLSLYEPVMSILGPETLTYQVTGKVKEQSGNRSNTSAPRDVYRTRDRKHVALSASIQVMAECVFRLIGRDDVIDDPRYRTNADRVRHRDEVNDAVADWVADRDRDEVLQIFDDGGVTASPVYDVRDVIADPHVAEREVLVDLPDDDLGSATHHNILPRLSHPPGVFRRPAPTLGQRTDELLEAVGYDRTSIREMKEKGIIG